MRNMFLYEARAMTVSFIVYFGCRLSGISGWDSIKILAYLAVFAFAPAFVDNDPFEKAGQRAATYAVSTAVFGLCICHHIAFAISGRAISLMDVAGDAIAPFLGLCYAAVFLLCMSGMVLERCGKNGEIKARVWILFLATLLVEILAVGVTIWFDSWKLAVGSFVPLFVTYCVLAKFAGDLFDREMRSYGPPNLDDEPADDDYHGADI